LPGVGLACLPGPDATERRGGEDAGHEGATPFPTWAVRGLPVKTRLLQCLCCLLVIGGLSASAVRIPAETGLSADPAEAASGSPGVIVPAPSGSPGSTVTAPPAAPPDAPAAVPGLDASTGQAAAPADAAPSDAPPADAPPADDTAQDDSLKGKPVVSSQGLEPAGVPGTWHLVFDEEFNTLNPAVWTPYWFNDCDPKSKMNGVKTCSSNITVANGEAVLQLSDSDSGALLSTNPKDGVSGHVGFQYTTGYVEARIYFPGTCSGGIYNWPAWWSTGQSYPKTGEIDIAEPLAGNMTTVYHSASGGELGSAIVGCWAGGYHTYGVNRMAGVNDIYFDGRRVYSYASQDGNAPHYLILNVGLNPNQRTFGPAGAIKVDWVRAWQ